MQTPLLPRIRQLLCRVIPAAALLYFLAWCYVCVRPAHSWDDAEPEVLNQAWRLAQGKAIYGSIEAPPYVHTAYTPLYLGVVAGLLHFTGLSYLPAKLVSFLAALAIGWAMARLSRQWTGQHTQGVMAFCFCFLVPAFLYNTVRAHVQMLAVAFSVWSFVFFLRGRFRDVVFWSPLLSLLAIYTKQTQLAVPVAIGVCLLLRNRRWFLPWAGVMGVGGVLPLLWMQHASGGLFLRHTVEWNRLSFLPIEIPWLLLQHAGAFFPALGLALFLLLPRLRGRQWEPVDLYLLVSFILTVLSLGRAGAHTQYVVELCIVTLLFLVRTTGLFSMRDRDALLVAQLAMVLVYTPLFITLEKGRFGMASNRAAETVYPLLRAMPGPILSEQGSFALFSGREPFIQPFDFSDLARHGKWDEGKLLGAIEQRYFAWVITEFPIEWPLRRWKDVQRFNPPVVKALRANYWLEQVIGPYYLYRPRPENVITYSTRHTITVSFAYGHGSPGTPGCSTITQVTPYF